jgi:hypothetical protein
VYELPKKTQKSSKGEKGESKEDQKTCHDFVAEKPEEILDIEGFKVYGNAFPYFFANVATKYYLNKSLEDIDQDDLQSLLEEFCTELPNLSNRRKISPDKPPFLYSGNDKGFAYACLTPSVLCNILGDSIRKREVTALRVYGTILPETGEHLKLMFPKLAELRRIKNIAIAPELLALATIGAFTSYTTRYENEQHCIFVDLVQEFRLDLRSLNENARSLMLGLIKGDSSELAVRVGIASVVADKAIRKVIKYDRALKHLPGLPRAIFYHIITAVDGQKVTLKSFNQYDVTDLALDIARLDIANPLVKLIKLYPSENLQKSHNEARRLRRIIEATCKAIYTWHSTKGLSENLEELYSVLRAFLALSRDREELEKLDTFITDHMKASITLSDILKALSEKMRMWV